jgi:hypothetical protein
MARGVTTHSRSSESYTVQEIDDGVDGLKLIATLTKPDDYIGSFAIGGGKSFSFASAKRRRRRRSGNGKHLIFNDVYNMSVNCYFSSIFTNDWS